MDTSSWDYRRPPVNCTGRCCCLHNSGGYTGGNGGISSQDICAAKEMRADIHRLIRSLGAFVEDLRVALRIEVEAGGVLDKAGMVNRDVAEAPMQGVKHEAPMRDDKSLFSSKKEENGNGLDVTEIVSGNRNGQGA